MKSPSKRVLQTVAIGLRSIEDHFDYEGFGTIEVENEAAQEPPEEEALGDLEDASEDDDIYREPYNSAGFDREDIEVAIDEFLSYLHKKRIVRQDELGALPLFSEVFVKLFGENHEVAVAAKSFEEYIEGYFGRIDYETMNSAYGEFCAVRDFINKELEAASRVSSERLFE